MPDIDNFQRIWIDIDQLRRELDALERKLATLSPEDIASIQVHLAVLENSMLNIKNHMDGKAVDFRAEIKRLDEEKVSKQEVRIPHLLIYGLSGAGLLAMLALLFEKIGLHLIH